MNPLVLYLLSACLATMRRSTGPEAHTIGAFAQDAPEYRFRWEVTLGARRIQLPNLAAERFVLSSRLLNPRTRRSR
jgi:hypothetical protein